MFSLVFLTIPIQTHAGVVSFVTGLFSDNKSSESINETNSQNMALLRAAVSVDPNPSKGGGDISIVENMALVSETGPMGSMANISDQKNSDKISIYVVRQGDSLSQIAKMFGVSTNTIVWANDIHNSVIKEGQTLVILPITGIRHEVEKGETIASIAKKYKGDLEEIMQYNNLTEDSKLAVGDIVIIPDGDMDSYDYSSSGKSSSTTSSSSSLSNPYRGGSGPYYAGYYIKPVDGVKTQGLHGYNAVDLGAPVGTPIVASASGDVIISRNSGWNGGYGSYVVLQHDNGTQTLYAHMSKDISFVGQHVVQGQVIGYVGSTGKSTGPHLHFEVRGAKNPF